MPEEAGSEREKRLIEFVDSIKEDVFSLDKVDLSKQVFAPELCINVKYKSDSQGLAHAMQLMPEGDACYVAFDNRKLAYGLRWYCISGDENGLGFCLPTTGTNDSSKYQYENGLFNTIAPLSSDKLFFKFGYLEEKEASEMKAKIEEIIKEK